MTDDNEPSRDELEQRVERLEATVEKMLPNRRQTLKGLGILGAGGLLGAAGGSASASTGSAGQIGTDADRPTIKADDVDANSVSTGDIGGAGSPYARTDDLSDVSVYQQVQAPGSQTTYTLLDVSDGPKVLMSLYGVGQTWQDPTNGNAGRWRFTIDGNTSVFPPGTTNLDAQDGGGDRFRSNSFSALRYDSSLKIEWEHRGGAGDGDVTQIAYVQGSGPHSVAVVADGESAYSAAYNLNGQQIEGMTAPDGYQIVKNPDFNGLDPFNAVWDDSQGKFVTP